MFGLVLPFVFLTGLALSLIALACGRRWVALTILILSLVLDIYAQCLPLRLHRISRSATGNTISVLTLNVHGESQEFTNHEQEITDFILEQDADFVLITEYYMKFCSDTLHNRMLRAGYTSLRRSWDTGDALYSRFEGSQERLRLTRSSTGSVTSIKASVHGTPLSIYYCHLASNNYDSAKRNYSTPDNIKNFEGLKFYLGRVNASAEVRRQEVDTLLKHAGGLSVPALRSKALAKDATTPTMIIGDMNDVSGSPALNSLRRAGFTDAWWKGGFGYGATIHSPLPFRIDHILYNDGLRLRRLRKLDAPSRNGWSDHDALFAEFSIG